MLEAITKMLEIRQVSHGIHLVESVYFNFTIKMFCL